MTSGYPGCPAAVQFFEQPLFQGTLLWATVRALAMQFAEFKKHASWALEHTPSNETFDTTIIRAELDHPDFAKYYAAKVGAM